MARDNSDRAMAALAALALHAGVARPVSTPEVAEEHLTDLVSDLHHLADRVGVDLAPVLERAQRHHRTESDGEAEGNWPVQHDLLLRRLAARAEVEGPQLVELTLASGRTVHGDLVGITERTVQLEDAAGADVMVPRADVTGVEVIDA